MLENRGELRKPCTDCGRRMYWAWPSINSDPHLNELQENFQQCRNRACQMYMAVVDVRDDQVFFVVDMRFDVFIARFYPSEVRK